MFASFDPSMDLEDSALALVAEADWKQVGDRNYPAWYFYSLGRYRAHPADLARLRHALQGIPRVDPSEYDLLFNALTLEWDVVKWVAMPEDVPVDVPGGWVRRIVREPIDVYSFSARERDPSMLSDVDFQRMRKHCTTLRGDAVDDEIDAENEIFEADRQRVARDRRLDFFEHHERLIKDFADEVGWGDLPPDEMAARYGGLAAEWDPDTFEN